jgi:hypothetical protein
LKYSYSAYSYKQLFEVKPMQEIKQLLKVIHTISSKNSFLSTIYKPNSLEGIFINGILTESFKSDAEAAKALYETDKSDVRFKMLKHRVKKKLYQNLLNTEIVSSRILLQKEMECLKLLATARMFIKLSAFDLALSLCSKIPQIAEEYEFNEILLSCIEIELAVITNQSSLKVFSDKNKQYTHLLNIVSLEKEAIMIYQQARAYLKSTVKVRKSHLEELPQLILRLKQIVQEAPTFECYHALYKTSILYYELIGDSAEIITITKEASEKVQRGEINPVRFDLSYNAYTLIYAHLRNKEYDTGLVFASDFYSLFNPSSRNWFAYMENYLLLALHAKQYELASVLLHRVNSNPNYSTISKDANERWQLYSAYLYFIVPAYSPVENFSYQSFINSLTEYSKDKQGFNVAILILQFMYFLKKGDAEALLYRIESLKKYIGAHLKDVSSARSRLFLKLLMLTVTEDFDAESCRVKGEKHYHKLIQTPTPGDAYAEIEIIPYEHLWELVLDNLPK